MDKIAPWPIVARSSLVRAFKPGADARAAGPFSTLRQKRWVTPGVSVIPHSGGRAEGRLTLFCALNVEAARQARIGKRAAALRLAKDAEQVERSAEFKELAASLSRASAATVRAILEGEIPARAPPGTDDLVRQIAQATEEKRSLRSQQWELAEITAGRIVKIDAKLVRVLVTSGDHALLPRWYSAAAHRVRVGDYLAVLTERLGDEQAIVHPVPAIPLEWRRHSAHPFELTESDLRLSAADVEHLSGKPAPLKIIVPVDVPA